MTLCRPFNTSLPTLYIINNTAQKMNIVELAVSNGSFTTLVSLLTASGLDSTLSGNGPFTVFAPTDAAFAKVPADVMKGLGSNPEQLKAVLTYHVVSGKHGASDVSKMSEATTVQGSAVSFSTTSGVKVNGASVITADMEASNGVVHVIDEVLIPQ